MIRNFFAGAVWGCVVAAAGLAVISEVSPLPQRQIAGAPGGDDGAADTGAADAVAPVAPVADAPIADAPVADAEVAKVDADANQPPAGQADVGAVATAEPQAADLAPAAPAPSAPAPAATPPTAAANGPDAPLAPEASGDAPTVAMLEPAPGSDSSIGMAAPVAPDVAGSDAAPVQTTLPPATQPETKEVLLQPAPATDAPATDTPAAGAAVADDPAAAGKLPKLATLPQITPDTAPAIAPEVLPAATPEAALRVLPQILPPAQPEAVDPAAQPATQPAAEPVQPAPQPATESGKPKILDVTKPSQLTPDANLPSVGAVSRLPRIGDDPAKADGSANGAAAEGGDATPLRRYARSFVDPADKPRYAIVLIDTGGKDLDRAKLAALPFPVTFAIDPMAENAQAAAMIYRAAGQEVVTLANGLPPNPSASDLEQSFQSIEAVLPESVAVMDLAQSGFQDDRPLAAQVVEVIKGQGRGLVTYDRGLNAADQVARRDGVPSVRVFRTIDEQGEDAPLIRRYLDRAAFKAAQEGRVVVVGQTRPETITALLEWTVEGRASSVALAPISAVLQQRQ